MTTLALSAPPGNVLAVVLFLVAGVIAGLRKDPVLSCLSFGLAALAWPW